ncbi:MAG: PAS domain S-box protein [Candidatus Thermoplasmatota archaeon]
MVDKAMNEGEASFEWTHKRLDGEEFPATVLLSRVEVDDEPFLQATVRDITERKEAERKLKKSERRFRRIFEASPDPTFLLNKDGVFIDVNKAALQKLGYDKEEIVDKELDELPFLEEKAVKKTVENFMKRMKGEEVPPYEIEMRSKDGDIQYAEINAKTFIEEEFEGEVVIARDITRRKMVEKQREELLHDLSERYKELDLLYSITRMGTETTKSLEDILEETVEMIPQGWQYPEITEAKITWDEKEYQTDGFEGADKCLSSDIELEDEKIGDITICYTEEKPDVEGDPFLEEEEELIKAVATVISNIIQNRESERKLAESEERYRTLVESSFAGISITDFDNNFTFANDRFAEMLGYEKEELIGKNIEDIVPEEELHKFEEETEKRKEDEISQYESRLKKKNGDIIDVMVYASPYKNAAGDFVGTMGVVSDITDIKETQEREELLNSLLRHDVLNKTQVIKGYLQLLEDKEVSEDTRRYIEKSKEANKESINLIQKIRLLLSAQKEEQKAVDIQSTILEAVGEVETIIEDKDIDLFMECPSTECEVKGGSLLKEVFSNLMENSVYHSEGSEIKISGEIKEEEVVCTVEDDGKGIPNEKKDTIFEKGYTTDEDRGTGLGLFLVKMLLESYDGEIEVKDSEMGGARFDVRLKKI